jgi:hypothetical protein
MILLFSVETAVASQWPTNWTALEAIATVFGAVGVWFAYQQFRLSTWLKLQEIYTGEAFRVARGIVFAFEIKDISVWTPKEREAASTVCQKMDELAHIKSFMFCSCELLHRWGHPCAKAWMILQPYVEEQRTKDQWPEKWIAFQELAEEAAKTHWKFSTNQLHATE